MSAIPNTFRMTPPARGNVVHAGTHIECLACHETWTLTADVEFWVLVAQARFHLLAVCHPKAQEN